MEPDDLLEILREFRSYSLFKKFFSSGIMLHQAGFPVPDELLDAGEPHQAGFPVPDELLDAG